MRKLFSILLVFLTIFSISVPTFAAESKKRPEDEYRTFVSTDDEGISPVFRTMAIGSTLWSYTWYAGSDLRIDEKAIDTGSANLSRVFVKYLTGSWAKASSYTWSSSNTASWSVSSGADVTVADSVRISLGLSKSRTTTYSVAITIPANASYFSKLGFASDYFQQNYRYEMRANGTLTNSYNAFIKTPTANTYLVVYYQ